MSVASKRKVKETKRDLLRAAEAVVDAALSCQKARSDFTVTANMRSALVRAVLQEPEITDQLFAEDARYLFYMQ